MAMNETNNDAAAAASILQPSQSPPEPINRLVEDVQRNDAPSTPPSMSPALPADDGMESLRQKMREIHELAVSTEEKARKMHLLMTRDYMALNKRTIDDGQEAIETATQDAAPRIPTVENPYNISPADLKTSYCPVHVPVSDEEEMPEDGISRTLGCEHYSRNVKVQCYDCNLWFPCRHCHDTSTKLPFAHQLNRQKTRNMLCMLCKTPQPAAEECMNCGQESAYYFCPKCKLWDNDSTKRIYHCDDCGICRRGEGLGKDYVHCKRCNVCISISTSSTHPCVERATDCDCPLCLGYLFSSSQAVVSLLCGHYMHATCYKDLMTVTYRCPVCNKSAVNMELQWRKLDDEIRHQPMPEEDFDPISTPTTSRPPSRLSSQPPSRPPSTAPELATPSADVVSDPQNVSNTTLGQSTTASVSVGPPTNTTDAVISDQSLHPNYVPRRRLPRKVWVGCNDCGGRGWTPFHWLGLKCNECDGYNTTQTTPLGNASTVRSVPATYGLQRQHDFTGIDTIRSFGSGDVDSGAAGLGELVGEEAADRVYNDCFDQATAINITNQQPPQLPPPEQEWEPHSPPGRSYFLRAEQEESSISRPSLLRPDRALSASASEMFGGVPYEMVMRLGRSLSPMRYYIDGLDLRGEPHRADVTVETAENNDMAEVKSRGTRTPSLEKEGAAESVKGKNERFWGSDGRFSGAFQTTNDARDKHHGGIHGDADDDEEYDDDDEEDDDDDDDGDSEEDDEDSVISDNEDEHVDLDADHEFILPGHY